MARRPRKVASSSSRAVCAAGGNSASYGRETDKSLTVCDLHGGLLVGRDEKAGFIFSKNWTIAGSRHAPEFPSTRAHYSREARFCKTEFPSPRAVPALEGQPPCRHFASIRLWGETNDELASRQLLPSFFFLHTSDLTPPRPRCFAGREKLAPTSRTRLPSVRPARAQQSRTTARRGVAAEPGKFFVVRPEDVVAFRGHGWLYPQTAPRAIHSIRPRPSRNEDLNIALKRILGKRTNPE